MAGSDYFDRGTNTFDADRVFCDDLLASRQAESVAELIVYYAWSNLSIPLLQKGFLKLVSLHFNEDTPKIAGATTFGFLAAVMKDISLVPYLVLRGVISEAGSVLRRALENLGVLTHLWADPTKLQFVRNIDSKEYREAFQSERNKTTQQDLVARGIKKRFACFILGMPASGMYELLSNFYVHGGSSGFLIHTSLETNQYSCLFHNRPNPEKININLLTRVVELLCFEIVSLYVEFARRYHLSIPDSEVVTNKFFELYSFPDPPSPEKQRQTAMILEGFRRQRNGGEPMAKVWSEWLHEKGLTRDKVTPQTITDWLQNAGLKVTEGGIPLIPGAPGQAQKCSRCGTLTECGVQGTSNGEPIVLCDECYLLLYRDYDRFHDEEWDKPLSEDDGV